MQEKGLEPSQYCYYRHLKPARLPIPPFLLITSMHPAVPEPAEHGMHIILSLSPGLCKLCKGLEALCVTYRHL